MKHCSLCHKRIKKLLECDVDPFGNFVHCKCAEEIYKSFLENQLRPTNKIKWHQDSLGGLNG